MPIGIPLSLFAALIILIKSSLPHETPVMDFAITADLLLTIPFVYLLIIRKINIPKTTDVPVMIVGLLIGSYFIPPESQAYLNLFKTWALPVIELTILIYVFLKVQNAIKKDRVSNGLASDFYSALKSIFYEILPKKMAL